MSIIRALVAHVLEAEAGSLEIEKVEGALLQPRSDLELKLARAMLSADAYEWSKKGAVGEFKPSPRQTTVAVRHAMAVTNILLEDA